MDLSDLRKSDLVEYAALNENGIEIFVTNSPDSLGTIIKDNNLESEVGGVAYQDSVNTCPSCGVLYYVEDLVQLENDIICEKCLEN